MVLMVYLLLFWVSQVPGYLNVSESIWEYLCFFPCPAISQYFGNNQKPNPISLRSLSFCQPLCLKVKIITVLLFSGCSLRPGMHLFLCIAQSGEATEMSFYMKQSVKGASGREGRKTMWETHWRKVTKGLMNYTNVFVSSGKKKWLYSLGQSLGKN